MTISRQELWNLFVEVLPGILESKGLTADDLIPTATLEELGISSIDTMHLMILIEERLQHSLNFNQLVEAREKFVSEITLGELMEQVYSMLHAVSA